MMHAQKEREIEEEEEDVVYVSSVSVIF